MNDDLKKEAFNVFNELNEETAKHLGSHVQILASDYLNIIGMIKLDDKEKLENYIRLTRNYIDSLKQD